MQRENVVALAVALALPALFVVFLRTSFDKPEVLDDPKEAYYAWYQKRYAEAEELSRERLQFAPDNPVLLSIAARAAAALHKADRVREYFDALPANIDDADPDVVGGFAEAAEALLEGGHVELAEELLRWSVEKSPWDFGAHRKLARVLRATGRRTEAHEHFVLSMRGEPAELVDLLTACSPDIRIQHIEDLAQLAGTIDEKPSSVQLGLGMIAYRENRWEEAESHFRRASVGGLAAPQAAAMVGLLLVEQERWEELQAWYDSLQQVGLDESIVWYLEGRWAIHRGELREAVRCLAEAVRRDPMNAAANEHLAATLRSLELNELAEPFQVQHEKLTELNAVVAEIPVPKLGFDIVEQPDGAVLKRVVELLDELGREWEAGAWAQFAETLKPPIDWAYGEVDRIAANLDDDSPAIIPAKKPIRGFQLSEFPLPEWSRHR